jgi:RNA polymerase sigma-70 factor (ECF subfamily)
MPLLADDLLLAPAHGVAATVRSAETDQALIARVLATADREAFRRLIERHQSAVRVALRKLTRGNLALADDLAQETFILAWRNLAAFRQEARFSTWIYRIAFNVYLAQMRKTRELLLDDLPAAPVEAQTVEDHAPAGGDRVDVQRALGVLSEPERQAVVACYYGDLSHEEAARLLGMPLGTLKTHILKAKQRLRAALE